MTQIVLILSSLIFVLSLLACNPTATNTSQPTGAGTPRADTPSAGATDTPEVVDPGFNILVVAEGDVQLKRPQWSDYHQTAFGTALERGDLLKLARGATATILCDGLSIWRVPAGVPAGLTNGCPQPSDKILVRGAAGIAGSTRGGDPTVPYIISPRSTKLLSETPTLRWNDSGAAGYTVQVRGGDVVWTEEGVTGAELVYSGEPALKPGTSYLLVVEDGTGKSSRDEGSAGLGFSLLPADEAQQVRGGSHRIAGLDLPDEAEAFALAQLYAGQNLIAEAIEILEDLIEEDSRQAAVHRALADLYAQIGLMLLAEPRYLEAVELAEAQGNVESAATSQASLGEVYVKLGNADEAIRWLTRAQAGYEALGDTERAGEIAERLEESNP